MRTIQAAGLVLLAAGLVHATPASGQRPEQISPSITFQQQIDPVERTDYSRVRIESAGGTESSSRSTIAIQCFGRRRFMWVGYDAPVVQARSLVWHIDAARPDTLHLAARPEMRAYGSPGLWLVLYPPREMVFVPDSVIPRWLGAARTGGSLAVRMEDRDGARDARFDVTGLARGLDQLACLREGAPQDATQDGDSPGEPRYWDPDDLDEVPIPADSASTALALRREVPSSEIAARTFGSVLGTVSISATGQVDSVRFPSERGDVTTLVRFLESVRFHPGRRDGQPVPSRISVYIQVADP